VPQGKISSTTPPVDAAIASSLICVSRISAQQLRDTVLDPGSFLSWDVSPPQVAMSAQYQAELTAARVATGLDESVLTGEGTVFGRRVAVVACEFDFLAGSIGVAAAERITAAIERATALRLPLLASPSSGGTRMQEGTVAFLQMVKIAAAVTLHKQAHLPYLVYLRHPTTGGVFASWGSLGHITVAEPGALVGFLGPRVYEQLYGAPFPAGVQTAENLRHHGVIDGVVPLDALRRKSSEDPRAALKQAAGQFEALFLQQLLKSMRATTSGNSSASVFSSLACSRSRASMSLAMTTICEKKGLARCTDSGR